MGALPREVALSLVHSVLCVPLGLHALWEVGWFWRYESGDSDASLRYFWWATSPATVRAVVFSSLYFFWEFWYQCQKGKIENVLHALMGFSSYALVGLWLCQGHILLCLSLLNELSTPFYNWYLIVSDRLYARRQGNADAIDAERTRARAGELFAIVFFLVRIVFMPLYLWCRIKPFIVEGVALPQTRVPAAIALVELSVSTALNIYWFGRIIRAAIRHRDR